MKAETRECWLLFIGVVGIVTIFACSIYKHRLNISEKRIKAEAGLRIAEIIVAEKAKINMETMRIVLEKNREIAGVEQALRVTLNNYMKSSWRME